MRIWRGERGRRVAIGVAGAALSMIGGVVAGQSAIGTINPIYTGIAATERSWQSHKPLTDTAVPEVLPTAYAIVAPSRGSNADVYPSNEIREAQPSAWERKLDAEYARWQSDLDRELRTQSTYEEPPLPPKLAAATQVALEEDAAVTATPSQQNGATPSRATPAAGSLRVNDDVPRDGPVAEQPL